MISNVLVQDICPLHVADHLTMGTFDAVGYALVMDALTHPGPAVPSRIARTVCLRAVMPGVSPVSVAGLELPGRQQGSRSQRVCGT